MSTSLKQSHHRQKSSTDIILKKAQGRLFHRPQKEIRVCTATAVALSWPSDLRLRAASLIQVLEAIGIREPRFHPIVAHTSEYLWMRDPKAHCRQCWVSMTSMVKSVHIVTGHVQVAGAIMQLSQSIINNA